MVWQPATPHGRASVLNDEQRVGLAEAVDAVGRSRRRMAFCFGGLLILLSGYGTSSRSQARAKLWATNF